MERSLKTPFSEHWRKSNVRSEVSQHVHVDRSEDGVSLDKIKIWTMDNKKFKRVKEAIYIRVMEPSLSKDGGRYLSSSSVDQPAEGQGLGAPSVPGWPLKLRPLTWFDSVIVEPTRLEKDRREG